MATIIESTIRSIRQGIQGAMDRQLLIIVFKSFYLYSIIIINEKIIINFVSKEMFVLISKKLYLKRFAKITCLVFMSYSIHKG